VLQAGGTRSLIPCENCVNFLKEYLLQIAVFQKEKVLILFQIDVFRRVEEIQVSLRTIPSMLQVGVSTALLDSDNGVCFERNKY
jgi:hypothetical protein